MQPRLAAGLVLCFGLVLCSTLPALAEEDPRPGYLALGDSVAFGYRASLPAQDYTSANNFVGYPEHLARELSLRLTNASCPGETSGSFSSATAPDNGCRLYRAAGLPLHATYSGTQLAFAIAFLRAHPDTRLVTLDLGANDLFLLQDSCAGSNACVSHGLGPLLRNVSRNLDSIYDRVRGEAGYRGQLVALTYYSPNYSDLTLTLPIVGLDLDIASDTVRHAGGVADGFEAFAVASAGSGGDACTAGLLNRLSSGACDVHPSTRGHALLAQAIRAVLQR